MLSLSNLKKLAAIVLMICFVLPLSRCNRNITIDPPQRTGVEAARQPDKRAAEPVYEDKYAYQNVAKDDPAAAALTIAAFFWPLLFVLFGWVRLGYRAANALNLVEALLCTGSAYMIFGITFFGTLRYGAYLAFLAVAAYFLAALAQVILRIRTRHRTTGADPEP